MLIQSSSAAGKTSLVEATLAFMPAEAQLRLSALTGQSLYYMGRTELKHKILAVAEEEGVAEAAYALKLLQSEGRLTIASAGKDSDTGRQQTQHYEVEGPVAMLLTTTAEEPDAELVSRCIRLSVNEQPAQTAAIHAAAAGSLHAPRDRRGLPGACGNGTSTRSGCSNRSRWSFPGPSGSRSAPTRRGCDGTTPSTWR